MQVTKLEEAGKNRYFLYLDGHYFASVDTAICRTFGLEVGRAIGEEDMIRLLEEALVRKARERALHLLDRQPYTRRALRDKVVRTNDPVYTDLALDQLEEAGILDDFSYGCALAEELIQTKYASNRQIEETMRRRGVSREAMSRVKEALPADETNRVRALVLRRLRCTDGPLDEKKLLAALLRKGYGIGAVKNGIRSVLEDSED